MPHVIIEYTAPLEGVIEPVSIVESAHNTLIQSGLFNTADIKTRAYAVEDFLVGEKGREGRFVHITVYLLEGRDVEKKQQLSEAILKMLQQKLPSADSLSVDVRELERAVYRKRVL